MGKNLTLLFVVSFVAAIPAFASVTHDRVIDEELLLATTDNCIDTSDDVSGLTDPDHEHRWYCTAYDRGWEEHFGGHTGYGFDQYEAAQSALFECTYYHRHCRVIRCGIAR